MTTLSRADDPISVPVLKMPAELALPALRILASHSAEPIRREALAALRPGVSLRNLLNAYVLPSLNELGLFKGTLKKGEVTRYGAVVAQAKDSTAHLLMARQLLNMDSEHVRFVEWLEECRGKSERKQIALKRFAEERLGVSVDLLGRALDRLGKWVGYLVHFGVVRETSGPRATWSVSKRHITALRRLPSSGRAESRALTADEQRDALLSAYGRASQQLGTKLYVPIEILREALGTELAPLAGTLLDPDLDEILRRAPTLLEDYSVSYSPFSGPARGGLTMQGMYAGYMSIRPRASAHRSGSTVGKDE
jgi:hypothetical protein